MRIARDLGALRAATAELRAGGRTLAFVPPMGALHAGHLALSRRLGGAVWPVAVAVVGRVCHSGQKEHHPMEAGERPKEGPRRPPGPHGISAPR